MTVAVFALTGCGTSTSETVRLDLSRVEAVSASLECDRIELYQDDVYFYDSMHGMNCLSEDGNALLLRVYEHSSSVSQVLPDWAPTLSDANRLTVGINWFAVGDPTLLARLDDALDIESTSVETYEALPDLLSESQRALGACSSFVAGEVRNTLFGSAATSEEAEQIYPGITSEVAEVVSRLHAQRTTVDSFETDVSELGPDIKKYCDSWEKKHAQ